MDIGVSIFPADTTIAPIEFGRAAEDLGFESVWFPEHSHIPTSRRTPAGGRPGSAPLPEYYARVHEQFTILAAIAAVTAELRLGTGVTLLAQRDPIWTAKQVATVDQVSGGRVIVGVGYGWNVEEMAHHGTAYSERRAKLREHALVMKALWTEEEASFDGEHIRLEPSWAWPKPVQRPHPPILMGAAPGPKTLADIVEFCDGWLPSGRRHDIADGIARIRRGLEDADREPDDFDVTIWNAPTAEGELEALAAAGANRAVFTMPVADPTTVLAEMRERSELVGRF